jgi:radical SAM superfamily enzyme YgiQ (UPF0313 family)
MTHNYDGIFITDTPHYPEWVRGYAAHRLATHLRGHGYKILVIDFSSGLTFPAWQKIIDLSVGPDTKFLGFSSTWWPFKLPGEKRNSKKINLKANLRDNVSEEYLDKDAEIDVDNTLTMDIVAGNVARWINYAKDINPKIKILLGGAKVDWYNDFPADHVFSGLAETQLLDFLEQPRRIWNKLINHDSEAKSRDWGWNTCFTRYSEIDQIRSNEILTLETTRGCRFKCIYCQFPLVGQKKVADYIKTKETLYNELLENYERWGATEYWIADDTFNDTDEKVDHVLEVVRRLPFQPKFRAYLRLDVLAMHLDQIPKLFEIGVRSCFFGIETFHPEAAKIIGKGMSEEKRKAALWEARKQWGDQVSINAGYIIGLPQEDYAHAKKQLEWFLDVNNPVDMVYYFPLMINPEGSYPNHPMSELDKNYQKYGYTIPDLKNHHYWFKDDGTDIPSFARSFEIIKEFNDAMESKTPRVGEQIRYGMGDSIKDVQKEYFDVMIKTLKEELQ